MNIDAAQVALLEQWMQNKEGERLEFKKAENRFSFDDLGKYCSALANEGGGRIIFGVTDSRPRQVVGSKAFEQPERTRKGLCDKLHLAIDFEEIHHSDCCEDSRVLVFEVPSRPVGMPLKYDGRYWMRKEDSLTLMSEDRLRAIFAESGRDFSAEVCPDLALSDLDHDAIETFRQRWIIKEEKAEKSQVAEHLCSLSVEQLLTDIDAMANGKLCYAALILFGTGSALNRYLAQSEIVFEYRSSDASGPAQDRKEFRSGFFNYYDELWTLINLRNDKQDFQEGLFVTPISTFSERPVREAILNAVCHRDYQLGGSIFIRQFARRLEIDSPGGLPHGITIENILDRQNPRNRRIAEILTRCGLVERSGQGMNLIYEELIKQSKPEPDFARTDQYQVGLTLHGTVQDPAFVKFVEKVSKQTQIFFSTQDWIVMGAASRSDKFPKELANRVARLVDEGFIERGTGRKLMLSRAYYEFVGKEAVYTRRKGLDREHNLALLLKHIQDNKAAGSKLDDLCQVLPSLPTTTVQSLLKTLKRRNEIDTSGRIWYPKANPEEACKPEEDNGL